MEIKLQGIYNIRDFSEYGFGEYIRSAHLHDMTEADAMTLRIKYNLKTVIDLRTTVEREELPDRVMDGVTYLQVPLFDEARIGISHEKRNQAGMALPNMPALYQSIVTDEVSVVQIKKVLEVINDPKRTGAILWHCTEGKDRCGIISALFLLSKGVDRETVIRDYLKTNEIAESRAEQYYEMVLEKSRNTAMAERVRDVFLAKHEYLEPIMDRLVSLAG